MCWLYVLALCKVGCLGRTRCKRGVALVKFQTFPISYGVTGRIYWPATKLTFCLPAELNWKIFIEVPFQEEPIDELIPSLFFIGTKYHIKAKENYDIDDDVQLVCKYLKALDLRQIDRLYEEDGPLVKFSLDKDLSEQTCGKLLKKYILKNSELPKLSQKLFIRYMKRRCKFLDELPAYNYNRGRGDIVMTIPYFGHTHYDTSNLGSVLMKAMLKEAEDFCDPLIAKKWANSQYQQLIYDFKDGGASFGLLSLNAFSKMTTEFDNFREIGIEPKSYQDLSTRKVQDQYLSRALSLNLNSDGLISAIDEKPYVLTLDYTIKMLNIHERRECGMPVILEGETGVGKTALVEMLSDLWNQTLIMNWSVHKERLLEAINEKLKLEQFEAEKSRFGCFLRGENIHKLTYKHIFDICQHAHEKKFELYEHIKSSVLKIRKNPMIPLIAYKSSKGELNFKEIEDMYDKVQQLNCSETFAELMFVILKSEVKSTFHKVNVHGALDLEQIQSLIKPALEQARVLNEVYEKQINSDQEISYSSFYVTIFFDEINTSSCQGLFKEIIIDRTLNGFNLPENIFIVAACNPHRCNSLASHETWIRGTYYVQNLHPTLNLPMWNYDSLSNEQEKSYIDAKLLMNKSYQMEKVHLTTEMTELILKSQKLMRSYAERQLKKNFECLNKEQEDFILKSSNSCVSQRDIQRVFTINEWFLKFFLKNKHHGIDNCHLRAILLALGLVYYLRLDTEFRKDYIKNLDYSINSSDELKFSEAFNQELDYFISKLDLPKGTAHTIALKENILAIIVCTLTHTPLIIVGDPGSSKTFSFNQCVLNLNGEEFSSIFYPDSEVFFSLDPHFYQCSYQTTSKEIETVFSRAINRQRSHRQFDLPIYSVVFMDEAGLPEESHESLKVLHAHLDKKEVSFVAITNHALDAAKTNRAVSLYRPKATLSELEILVRGCLQDFFSTKLVDDIVKLCQPYLDCMKEEWFSHLFGLRDFHHFILHLQRKCSKDPSTISVNAVLRAFERNFNGSDKFNQICSSFMSAIYQTDWKLMSVKKGVVDVLRDSMQDQAKQEFETNPVRYKLIIDPSQDNSLHHILFPVKFFENKKVRMFFCSDFPNDGELEAVNTIAAIRHCAGEGHTVIMCQTNDIHASFYDLFNQKFKKIESSNSSSYFCNIAIGAHSQPSRVDPNFQCVIIIRKSDVKDTPGPLLNRFEKYLISHKDILNSSLSKLPPNMIKILDAAQEKVEEFLQHVNATESLYGYQTDSLSSLLLDFVPNPQHQYKQISKKQLTNTDGETPFDLLCITLLKLLRENSGFNIPKYSKNELYVDAESINNILSHTNISECLERDEDVWWGIEEAFTMLYDRTGKKLDLHISSCFVLHVLEQLIIRILLKRLMQLMSTEALILYRNAIPLSYLYNYLKFQTHFSLKETITSYYTIYCHTYLEKRRSPNKLIIFTRSSSLIHDLPHTYPYPNNSYKEQCEEMVKNYIFVDQTKLQLHKLSHILSQNSAEEIFSSFMDSECKEILVLIANMRSTSTNIINHVRFMIEESEHHKMNKLKLFVLILHFSPNQSFNHIYPTLYLREWDHYYLDTITITTNELDIPNWLQQCCLDSDEIVIDGKRNLDMVANILLPTIIPLLSAKMLFDNNERRPFNTLMNASEREENLRCLLNDFGLGKTLCEQFCLYWNPSVMLKYLQNTAYLIKKRNSVLNLTESIQTQFKFQLFYFCLYILSQVNENNNLDVLFHQEHSSSTRALFLSILRGFPLPELEQLSLLCSTLAPPQPSFRVFHFPFFLRVYNKIEKIVDLSCDAISSKQEPKEDLENELKLTESTQQLHAIAEESLAIINKEDAELSAVVKATDTDQNIWNLYLDDYMYMSCMHYFQDTGVRDGQHFEDVGSLILHKHLEQFQNNKSNCLVIFHCYARIFKLNIAHIATSLRPLEMTKEIPTGDNSFKDSTFYQESRSIILKELSSIKFDVDSQTSISLFILLTLFGGLLTAAYPTNAKNLNFSEVENSNLYQWFKCYRNIIAISCYKKNIYLLNFEENKDLKVQFDLMQSVYIMIRCSSNICDISFEGVTGLFYHLVSKHFNEHIKLDTKSMPNMATIAETMFELLQCEDKDLNVTRKKQIIVEELIEHYFSSAMEDYDQQNLKWVLSGINCQNQITALNCIPPIKLEAEYFKHIRLGQLIYFVICLLKSKCDNPSIWYLTNSNEKVRLMIGETLLQSGAEGRVSPYIPFYFNGCQRSENELMKQPLVHIYFIVMAEKIRQNMPDRADKAKELLLIANKIKNLLEQLNGNVEQLLLQIEFQAVLQVLLQHLATLIDCEVAEKLPQTINDIKRLLEESNQIILVQGYQRILLFHLSVNLHGSRNLAANCNFLQKEVPLFDHSDMLNLQICVKQDKLHQLTILNITRFKKLYEDVSKVMKEIHNDSRKSNDLQKVYSLWCKKKNSKDNGFSTFRMIVWFVVYNEFYSKKISSTKLCLAINESGAILGQNCIQLLQCFLDTNKMIKNQCQSSGEYGSESESNLSPIYKLFNPHNDKLDQSDSDLKLALANLIGVILGSSSDTNHLWYHLFESEKLCGTYMTGFMYDQPVGSGDFFYNHGIELTLLNGNFARKEYGKCAYKGSFTHHSLYLLLWANFSTFCVALLTQSHVERTMCGSILSSQLNPFDYCFNQMQMLWKMLRDNLKLTEERRSHFVTLVAEKMFQAQQLTEMKLKGICQSSNELFEYEKNWHVQVYQTAWNETLDKYICLSEQNEHPIYSDLRDIEEMFPVSPKEDDLCHYMISQGKLELLSENGEYHSLLRFTMDLKQLEVGGELLPDLIELYSWIHTNLSLHITQKKANVYTFKDIIDIIIKNSKNAGAHLKRLYDQVIVNCRRYYQTERRIIESVGTEERAKHILLNNKTPLIHFLSGTEIEGQGKDYLYQLIVEIVRDHNDTIKRFYSTITKKNSLLLPASPHVIHPTEVTPECVIISGQNDVKLFHSLLRSCYLPSFATMKLKIGFRSKRSISHFELDELEKKIAASFIRGKPRIELSPTKTPFKTAFKYRKEYLSSNPANLNIIESTLEDMKKTLPPSFTKQLPDDLRSELTYQFHSSSYTVLSESATFLIIVINHLMNELKGKEEYSQIEEGTVSVFMMKEFKTQNFHQLMEKVKVNIGSHTQKKVLEVTKLKFVYSTITFFYNWLYRAFYNFSSVPQYLKRSMDSNTRNYIEMEFYLEMKKNKKLFYAIQEIKKLTGAFEIAQNDLITNADDKLKRPITEVLLEKKLIDENAMIMEFIPESVKLCHFVDFWISIKRVLNTMEQESSNDELSNWPELVDNLLTEYLPHIRIISFENKGIEFIRKNSIFYGFPVDIEEDNQDQLSIDLEKVPIAHKSEVQNSRCAEDFAKSYSVGQVCKFLKEIKLSQYEQLFRDYKIDGYRLFVYSEEDLEEIGVDKVHHQILITQLFSRKVHGILPKYDSKHLLDFLARGQLAKYAPLLLRARIDGDMILTVSQKLMVSALKELGMKGFEAKNICADYEQFKL